VPQPPANPRLAFNLFAVFAAVAASAFYAAGAVTGQHWSVRALGSLLFAHAVRDLGVAAYLRLFHARPRRSEGLFLVLALMTGATGWYALRHPVSLALVAGATLAIVFARLVLRPWLFDPWWAGSGDGNVVTLPADDPGLAEAKAQAVATVPEFLRRLAAPGADVASAAVKAPLPVPGGTEHVWLAGVRCEGGEFVGTVDNEPSPKTGVRSGDTVRVRHSEISDWKLVENGRLVGGFTIRYFMSRMPAKQRAALSAALPFTVGPEAIPPAA
jgi:uncharacterized protein YegJ (DUF2314 family)